LFEVSGTGRGHALSASNQRIESERFHIEVRAPVPWLQGVRAQAGFRVDLESTNASLDSLLAGRAKISLVGPPERQVAVQLRTFDFNGHLSDHTELGRLTLPTEDTRRLVLKLTNEPLAEKV
jgi:hypothetical protein